MKKTKILLLDGNADEASVFLRDFSSFHVKAYATLEAAVSCLETESVDAIVSDLNVGLLPPDEFFKKLSFADVPVVIFSEQKDMELVERLVSGGYADDYIEKGTQKSRVTSAINIAIARSRSRSQQKRMSVGTSIYSPNFDKIKEYLEAGSVVYG